MPHKPDARRRMNPSQRGYARIWLREERKKELAAAAKDAGYTSLDDYLWHLFKTHQPQG